MGTDECNGRIALVTGGSRGIGREISLLLAREGAEVAINYVSDETAAKGVASEIEASGGKAITVQADVSDPAEVARMVKSCEDGLGPIDLLVCNAGISRAGDPAEMTFEGWRRVIEVNLNGVFLPVMAVKDGMIERGDGRIVCIASIAGLRPRPQNIPYATSKAAVIAFVRNISAAIAPEVRINAVAPGLIETDMVAPMDPARREAMIEATPLKRIGRPQEIAEMTLFLLSDRSSYTTGQTLIASGGRVVLP